MEREAYWRRVLIGEGSFLERGFLERGFNEEEGIMERGLIGKEC